jgi:nucleotide-binding universal stress UspA family protein
MIVADEPLQVLLALRESDCAPSCLQRTYDLTCALRSELQVLRVLPASSRLLRVFRPDPTKAREEARVCLRATRSWLANAFGEEPPAGRVLVRRGNFVDAVVQHTQSTNVELIIMPPHFRRVGALATQLARRTGVKVLVAHEPSQRKAILAATDLASDGFPVLQQAARLGLALHVPLTAFHNVDPLAIADRAAGRLARGAATALAGAQRQVRLADAVRSLPVATTPVVRVEIDPVFAILEEARRQEVDIVVVGVHERSRLERLLHGSVAARVVQRTQRSVLVTPIS